MSETVAKITIGALIGVAVGLLIGLVLASTSISTSIVGNPFLYASIGIAVGASVSTVFGKDKRD